tara:strand:+ start:136 stop:429 length:294 start_codon:yes stop_codon:yes gene_type:complete
LAKRQHILLISKTDLAIVPTLNQVLGNARPGHTPTPCHVLFHQWRQDIAPNVVVEGPVAALMGEVEALHRTRFTLHIKPCVGSLQLGINWKSLILRR